METAGGAFQSFTTLAERQPGRYGDKPFLTWYDDARGQRVELSFKTFDNWVAKVANLLVDELDAGPGDRVAAVLVDCWQTAVVLAACWRVGAGVVAVDPGAGGAALAAVVGGGGVAAAFVGEEWTAEAAAFLAAAPGRPALVALTADLTGRSEHDLGAARNFARVVPATGDRFAGAADPGGEALRWMPGAAGSRGRAGQAATMAGLLGEAARLASLTGLRDGDRLLSGSGLLTPVGVATGLLAPFGSGAGVVLASAFEPARFWKRVADERVTVAALSPRLGRVGAGDRPAARGPGPLPAAGGDLPGPRGSPRRSRRASLSGWACRCCREAERSSTEPGRTTISSDAATWYFACSCRMRGEMS